MTAVHDQTTGCTLTLTEEERVELLAWLEQKLKNKLVEEHRTETAAFRAHVVRQEAILRRLIEGLRQP
jgi:hypothetical protein